MSPPANEQNLRVQRALRDVEIVVRKFSRRWPKLSFEDLLQVAIVSLTALAQTFDPTRGTSFKSYYRKTLTWDLLDYAVEETYGLLPELQRMRLAAGRGEPGESGEDDLEEAHRQGASGTGPDLEKETEESSARIVAAYLVASADAPADDPEEAMLATIEARRRAAAVHCALETMPEKSARALRLLYWEDMTLMEAATEMGVGQRQLQRYDVDGLDRVEEVVTRATDIEPSDPKPSSSEPGKSKAKGR